MVEAKELVRVPISVTLPKECVEWLDVRVKTRVYANRSHAIEVIILDAMKSERKFDRKIELLKEDEKKE